MKGDAFKVRFLSLPCLGSTRNRGLLLDRRRPFFVHLRARLRVDGTPGEGIDCLTRRMTS